MTPEQELKLNMVFDWMNQRKKQQISLPLDDASREVIGNFVLFESGAGNATLTQNINITGNPQTITVPAAFTDTIELKNQATGQIYEIPYLP